MKQLEDIPYPGLATAKDMKGLPRWPGRNHPHTGRWLWERYAGLYTESADPMYGAGALWWAAPCAPLQFADIEPRPDIPCCELADARTWTPRRPVGFAMFSPPFLQNHSSGATEHQKQIREKKSLHAMQEFGAAPGNLGRMKPTMFWDAMDAVYRQVFTYAPRLVVIVRNYIRSGFEVNVVDRHAQGIARAGYMVEGAHRRDLLRPTGYQQWKVARDPSTPWVRYEYALVARREADPFA